MLVNWMLIKTLGHGIFPMKIANSEVLLPSTLYSILKNIIIILIWQQGALQMSNLNKKRKKNRPKAKKKPKPNEKPIDSATADRTSLMALEISPKNLWISRPSWGGAGAGVERGAWQVDLLKKKFTFLRRFYFFKFRVRMFAGRFWIFLRFNLRRVSLCTSNNFHNLVMVVRMSCIKVTLIWPRQGNTFHFE